MTLRSALEMEGPHEGHELGVEVKGRKAWHGCGAGRRESADGEPSLATPSEYR